MVAYSFRPRFVMPIAVGLGLITPRKRVLGGRKGWATAPAGPLPLPKRQTIRASGKRRHVRPGETIQLYTGMRTKQCHLIGLARCVSVDRITIWVHNDGLTIQTALVGGYKILGPRQLKQFALDDGFEHPGDMWQFWLENHGAIKFEGYLIKWEPITDQPTPIVERKISRRELARLSPRTQG